MTKNSSPRSWRLTNVRRPGSGTLGTLDVVDGSVTALSWGRPAAPGDGVQTLDARGRWLLPGLADAHVHATQHATEQTRVDVGRARSAHEAAVMIASSDRARSAPTSGADTIVASGFRDALWAEPPTVALLDSLVSDRPVVAISADLHCGWLNSRGLELLGIPTVDGPVREAEWMEAMVRLPRLDDDESDRLVEIAMRAAAARGVTRILDFEFGDNLTDWQRRDARGRTPLRVECSVLWTSLSPKRTRGLRSGQALPGTEGLVTMGPVKLFVDGSLNTRTALCHDPYPDALTHGTLVTDPALILEAITVSTGLGLGVAAHAIGDMANHMALDAFEQAGVGGRIEHAQLVDPADLPRFGALDVIAGVQPAHVLDDRDAVERHWTGRDDRAFPYAALARAGARLEAGSDAPVGPLDPWITMAAAVHRSDDDRPPFHPEHHLGIGEALSMSIRTPLAPGGHADIVLVEDDPLALAPDRLRNIAVGATAVAGRWVHGAPGPTGW